jgi:hypothetical protein
MFVFNIAYGFEVTGVRESSTEYLREFLMEENLE